MTHQPSPRAHLQSNYVFTESAPTPTKNDVEAGVFDDLRWNLGKSELGADAEYVVVGHVHRMHVDRIMVKIPLDCVFGAANVRASRRTLHNMLSETVSFSLAPDTRDGDGVGGR